MIALFSVSVSFGQGRVVTGTVTEADTGDPIPGANVVVKGTASGSVTDVEGKYSVSVSDEGATLVYSFVGFVTQEIEVGNQSALKRALVNGSSVRRSERLDRNQRANPALRIDPLHLPKTFFKT